AGDGDIRLLEQRARVEGRRDLDGVEQREVDAPELYLRLEIGEVEGPERDARVRRTLANRKREIDEHRGLRVVRSRDVKRERIPARIEAATGSDHAAYLMECGAQRLLELERPGGGRHAAGGRDEQWIVEQHAQPGEPGAERGLAEPEAR